MFTRQWTAWVLILGSYATAAAQAVVPEAFSHNSKAGSLSRVAQLEKDKSFQPSLKSLKTLLTAKTVLIVFEPLVQSPARKAEQALKKALVRWGRFQVVDDAESADLIILISECSSSRPPRTERVSEELAIFAGGSTPYIDATPLWAVTEVGPVLGQRPTGKLVADLRKHLIELEQSVLASNAPSPT